MMKRPPASRTVFLSAAASARILPRSFWNSSSVSTSSRRVLGEGLGVAAEHDVGAAARHVGGDRDGAGLAGLRHDVGLLLVELGVQDDVRHLAALQQRREPLGLLDRDRADQDRLARLAQLDDLVGHRVELLALGDVDDVLVVVADHRHVRRDDDDVELVDLVELAGLGVGRARHAGELLVEAEVVLERDRRERLVLALDLDVLFRLDGLVEPVGPAAARQHAAGELVHDQDLAVLDHVVHVFACRACGRAGPARRRGAGRCSSARRGSRRLSSCSALATPSSVRTAVRDFSSTR